VGRRSLSWPCSRDRQQKELAIHQRFMERMQAHLQKMQESAKSEGLKDLGLAQRRLGPIQQQHWLSLWPFEKITAIDPPKSKVKLAVHYSRDRAWNEWAALSEGCYLLRSYLTDVNPRPCGRGTFN